MTAELTEIEKKAVEAQSLPSFPINVEEIRRTVETLLTQFGRGGLFEEYTIHSFEHVYEMLKSLEWLVPADTRPLLTNADWLLVTLSCYFHDLGLLVTRDEFEARNQSGFRDFAERVLFAGDDGPDYRAKIDELSHEAQDRFLYQEFVRYHHAARVRDWIIGKPNVALGQAQAAADQINRLLSPLNRIIRTDLANICESHNLDDLASEQKYPLYRPYGSSEDEVSNIQYVALLLRTTDLIQITSQRAPTVLYKLINPKDPVSQVEWLKQNAVRHVRPQPKIDRAGQISREVQSDTIEVYADFSSPDGYFGLTSYLQYAGKQLQSSHELAEKSKRSSSKKYSFPWRFLDDGHIKTEGFIPRKFGFQLDQERILDLLTGHTLYNNSAVVLRELAQNAIDAVRLQADIEHRNPNECGKVEIRWNSKDRELEVLDNGTGMTQDVIERHLLKVGSSRYQDEKFREEHPNFSPISRFGIGVLSAFMVADQVEIVTCSTDDKEARQISLRSVHGRYLIRLLDKHADCEARALVPHGTKFKLKLRPTAKTVDVLAAARRWIVFPRCNVTVHIDDGPSVDVGFNSTKAALEDYLSRQRTNLVGRSQYRVEERNILGLSIAYALRFDTLFHDWSFISFPERAYHAGRYEGEEIPGTCVEGIAVQFASPGFDGPGIVSIVNTVGTGAPKTNVARSSLENTPESREITRKVYEIFMAQIDDEAERLVRKEKYSLSWATSQMAFLARPLRRRDVADEQLLSNCFAKLKLFLLEEGGHRSAVSLERLRSRKIFWSSHSSLTSSIERLIQELPGNVNARAVFELAANGIAYLPAGPLITNIENGSMALGLVSQYFEVDEVRASNENRYLQLRWSAGEAEPKWLSSARILYLMNQLNEFAAITIDHFYEEHRRGRRSNAGRAALNVPMLDMPFGGADNYTAVSALGNIYFKPGIAVIEFIKELANERNFEKLAEAYIYLCSMQSLLIFERGMEKGEVLARLEQMLRDLAAKGLDRYVPDWSRFTGLAQSSSFSLFDPLAWSSRGAGNVDSNFSHYDYDYGYEY